MLFRNPKLVRSIACFFLLEFTTSLLSPAIGWAVTGPSQQEFTSYEASGSPDMVNLTTGDFTYNVPVLDVPGPERSFSLPLTYRAGIRLEQEASWVGLGWSLNAGAIARSMNGYPDDADGETMRSTYKQDITRGWTGGVPGLLQLGWDVNTGHSGSASLLGLVGLGWSNGGISSGELVGIHANKEGVTIDPIGVASAALTIATLGASSTVTALALEAGKQLGTDAVTGVVASELLGKNSSTGASFGQPTVKEDKGFLHTNYWVFYNDDKREFMYGSLHFDDMSKRADRTGNLPHTVTNSAGTLTGTWATGFHTELYNGSNGNFEFHTGADLSQYAEPNEGYYESNKRPFNIAHDDFSVMGGQISGSIRPYRLEVGSVAFPRRMSNHHDTYSDVPFADDYKVPFRYENSISNSYDFHEFAPSGSTTWDPTGIDANYQYNFAGGITLRDPQLNGAAARTAATRKGIINRPSAGDPAKRERGFVQGKNIKWFTNQEILDLYATSNDGPGDGSFLEFDRPTTSRASSTTTEITGWHQDCPGPDPENPQAPSCYDVAEYGNVTVPANYDPWRLTLPGKGVGAFAVTSEDGTTYHYSLPVYHYVQYSRSRDKSPPAGAQTPGVSTQTIGVPGTVTNKGGYATTWLLTAITSSDYIDRGGANGAGNGTVDPSDWGGWVRFEYGKFSDHYKWRQPYVGESYTETDLNNATYSEGAKETYYLNAIRTRTHTALFVKSVRNDGRGHFQTAAMRNQYGLNLGLQEQQPASSLRLDEIILLSNADYARLQTADGIRTAPDNGSVIPAFSTDTQANATQFQSELGTSSGDSYAAVLDSHDITADARIRSFMNQRALKRVVFNYSYRLCNNTPNSFASVSPLPSMDQTQLYSRTGKLTLESLSMYGPANTKLAPDFLFRYDNNPDYLRESWDGFGMYKSGGTASLTGHRVSTNYATASADGAAWSMTEIVSPLGGKTRIKYERDQYAKVSEYNLQTVTLSSAVEGSNVFTTNVSNAADYLRVGQVLGVVFNYSYSCSWPVDTDSHGEPCSSCTNDASFNCPVGRSLQIIAISGNTVTFDPTNIPSDADANCVPPSNLPSGSSCSGVGFAGAESVQEMPGNKNGGDIRVAALSTLDEMGREYQIRYGYTLPLPAATNSSGVISKEPAYIERVKRPFDTWYDYPGTAVMYGKTSVFRGVFRNNVAADYTQREEYTFFTPVSSMIQTASTPVRYGRMSNAVGLETRSHVTTVDLGKIGQPIAIRKFNRQGELEVSSVFEYTNAITNADGITGQGVYTEGAMTNELLDEFVYRINRSTTRFKPTILVGTTTTTNGISSHSQEDKFDFYTGKVLESSFKSFLGEEYSSKIVPAYTLPNYAAMGPATQDPANRNMLMQEAAAYTYKKRTGGNRSVMAASIQTWNGDWRAYRGYNATADAYEDRADDPRPVWRLHESYVWSSPRLNGDGTYADGDYSDFDWTRNPLSGQTVGWVKAGEFTRYDHYSKPLESKDVNGQYTARKLDAGQNQRLLTAANARYTEIAYSGAEDLITPGGSASHFGGEVRDGGKRSADYSHTGSYSSKLLPGETGFTYKAAIGTEVRGGRKYRLSCWVHSNDAVRGGQLYAKLDGTDLGSASIASANTKRAGAWYLLNLLVDVPTSGQQLVVGCRNAGAQPVYVDDFRFHPVQGPATAYVYAPHTGQVTHVLDNENLYTRYTHDNAGRLLRVYKETLDRPDGSSSSGEHLVKEYAYNFARNAAYNIAVGLDASLPSSLVYPANSVSVLLGDDATFSISPPACTFFLSPSFIVDGDGVNRYGTYALSDGTQFTLTGTQVVAHNVHGAHSIALSFYEDTNIYPTAGTLLSSSCDTDNSGCSNGYETLYYSDGCGGDNGPVHQASGGCQPRPECYGERTAGPAKATTKRP